MKTKLSKQKIVDSYIGGLINYGIISLKFLNPFKKDISKKPKKIVIYKLDAIGDSILSLPMIKHLHKKTKAEIIVACSKQNKDIFKNHKFIHRIVEFDSSKLNLTLLMINIFDLRDEEIKISIDCAQSSNLSAILSWLTTKHTIGFKKTAGVSRNKVYDCSVTLDPNKHMVLNYFDLLKPLGIDPPKKIELVPLYSSSNIKTIFKNSIVVHPCNIFPYKTWPEKRWREVIKYLTKKNHVVVIGSEEEVPLVKKLLRKINTKKVTNLTGKTNLRPLISLISSSKMFVGMDGGPMHIAASMNVPTTSIFGHETPTRYAPFNKKSIALHSDQLCSPCTKSYNDQSPDCEYPLCLRKIFVEDVIKAIDKLLK